VVGRGVVSWMDFDAEIDGEVVDHVMFRKRRVGRASRQARCRVCSGCRRLGGLPGARAEKRALLRRFGA
jgi:hypothetical protein